MSDVEKEIQQLKKRFSDLADQAERQGIFTFTAFLSLSEQDVFWKAQNELRYAGYELYGGTEQAERVMIRFGNSEELGYEVPFPVKCIHITPVLAKFAEPLTHRDFLGAIMNLGIERSTIGDILTGEKEAYVFCTETVAGFICEHLDKIRHTNVKCVINEGEMKYQIREPETVRIQVVSLRADAVIAKVYNKSRKDCLDLFQSGKVFIDGRLCENNSRILKSGETVNARGYGKFILSKDPQVTRKGKISAEILVYR